MDATPLSPLFDAQLPFDLDLFPGEDLFDALWPENPTQLAIAATSAALPLPKSQSASAAASPQPTLQQQQQTRAQPIAATVDMLNDPRIACNNKTLLDARWPTDLLQMTTVQLNRYLRTHHLSADDEAELKAARRRYKSRGYSKTLRDKRRSRRGTRPAASEAASDHESEADGEADAEHDALVEEAALRIAELETANGQLLAQNADLESRLLGMNALYEKIVANLILRGIDISELNGDL